MLRLVDFCCFLVVAFVVAVVVVIAVLDVFVVIAVVAGGNVVLAGGNVVGANYDVAFVFGMHVVVCFFVVNVAFVFVEEVIRKALVAVGGCCDGFVVIAVVYVVFCIIQMSVL